MIYTVTIIGLNEHSKTLQLLRNVQAALEVVESPIIPHCVTDLEEFMRLQLAGIPALQLNGEVVSEKRVLSVTEIIAIFEDAILD